MPAISASPRTSRFQRALALGGICAASAAQASLVNVDFNSATSATYSGAAVLGVAGNTWNGVVTPAAAVSNLALKDATGAATTARLALNAGGFGFAASDSACPTFTALLCDYLVANNRTITFSISGLTGGDPYDLILYAFPQATNRTVTFRVGSTTKTATSPGTIPSSFSFIENQNYTRFTGTVAANGIVAFDLIGGQFATEGDFNGFQLNVGAAALAVPEPTGPSLVLAGLAAAALQRRSRRR